MQARASPQVRLRFVLNYLKIFSDAHDKAIGGYKADGVCLDFPYFHTKLPPAGFLPLDSGHAQN